MKHLNIKIFGKVQGVFFRQTAKKMAEEYKVKGFIRNEPDKTVYVEVEGGEEGVNKFLKWCKKGPPAAIVEKVDISSGNLKRFGEFSVVG